ncbi:hypothetical protein VHEMI01354 [[Torrubiella] hemipterigena]|uniref:Carboxymethylenebutenolidase n=1 Tax=[Torrubiella] hemipterigena TaxID=1531966 RepID=A0A0A1T4J6_9HYPO|nr:hypothetical protein VHEMI01354 [[Torrubiella] hemipterigena]
MSSAPVSYDPNSTTETTNIPELPNAPRRILLNGSALLQPPLSRRGSGPGIILITAQRNSLSSGSSLDPDPIQKWAEEGFAVVGTHGEGEFATQLGAVTAALKAHDSLTVKDKFGLIIYDEQLSLKISSSASMLSDLGIACVITVSSSPIASLQSIPLQSHIAQNDASTATSAENTTVFNYNDCGVNFILPYDKDYNPSAAALAHTRNLVFLRKHLGGPHFDLVSIWEEHTKFEFEERSVARTMATMVAEPYVNHLPTMTGGRGRANLTAFYRDNFIFCNPPDTVLSPLSRTVGPDRVVDEFIFSCTHTSVIPWLLPGVQPTNVKISVPMLAVVNVRGDRLYHEHIWWDQASVLRQIGILPSHLDHNGQQQKLPVSGTEQAQLLIGAAGVEGNQMLSPEWTTS